MDSIQKVNKVCKAVKNLTEEDFKAVLDMAKKQTEYIHPLKMATASKLNDTGDHNFKVIEALQNCFKT
ncbi:MAG: hypothetical protein PHW73_00315 [Atribacterota bacterium]|nr:hypothetical protein [Atribacterota bacterium]